MVYRIAPCASLIGQIKSMIIEWIDPSDDDLSQKISSLRFPRDSHSLAVPGTGRTETWDPRRKKRRRDSEKGAESSRKKSKGAKEDDGEIQGKAAAEEVEVAVYVSPIAKRKYLRFSCAKQQGAQDVLTDVVC